MGSPLSASNYSKAIDSKTLLPDKIIQAIDWINARTGWNIPTGASNCTLSATQWVDPTTPISRAQTIIDNGEQYGYKEIPEMYALPNDLVIATNPNNNAHHTMQLVGFDKDHPLVTYSSGTTQQSGIRRNKRLKDYIDNSYGKTDIKYFRHYKPGEYEVLLPEIVVTPNK